MPSKLEARVTQHDREIAAIRKLILQGMKMLVENGAQIKALAVAQRATDKRLDALSITVDRFIRSLERGGSNGHSKTKIH
jgi:hypothetical protein